MECFAQAGVTFSKTYPNGIPRFLSTEFRQFDPKYNYFLRIGGFLDAYLENNKKHFDVFHKLGYSFKKFDAKNALCLMKQTFRLIRESYRVFPLFTTLSEEDFLQEFETMPILMDPTCSTFGYDTKQELYGFCMILKDVTEALRSMNGKTDFLAKCRFLLNSLRSIRKSRKYTSVVFSLMREEGMINLQIKDCHSNERTYAVYELPLNP